jgi:hypothetical protein
MNNIVQKCLCRQRSGFHSQRWNLFRYRCSSKVFFCCELDQTACRLILEHDCLELRHIETGSWYHLQNSWTMYSDKTRIQKKKLTPCFTVVRGNFKVPSVLGYIIEPEMYRQIFSRFLTEQLYGTAPVLIWPNSEFASIRKMSHVNYPTVKFCLQHKIVCCTLPSKTSGVLQPLNVPSVHCSSHTARPLRNRLRVVFVWRKLILHGKITDLYNGQNCREITPAYDTRSTKRRRHEWPCFWCEAFNS